MAEARVEIQPELWVGDAAVAVAFYARALGDDPDLVAQLSVAGARFWVA